MRLFIILISLLFAGCATTQNFVEKSAITSAKESFPALSAHNEASAKSVDHTALTAFLSRYLVTSGVDSEAQGANLVKYASVSPEDRAALASYVRRLEATKVTRLSRDEQLAFWINLYNAETIRVILESYPVDSIRDIKSHPLDFKGPWNDKRLSVEGQILTLDNIENRIVRPVFDDPRIHYALNCAAIGCPNLRSEAYSGVNIDEALDEQARAFINNPRGVDVTDNAVTASRIFLWYKSDYGRSEADILEHVRAYANDDLRAKLDGKTSIDDYAYNWALNSKT